MMSSFSHLSSSDGRTPVPVPEGHAPHGCRGCNNEEGGNEHHCCIAAVDERLEHLAHSVSQDVIPGLERELNKVRGWLAMLEAREDAGTTTTAITHGDAAAAIGQEEHSSGGGGGASSGIDLHQSSLSREEAKLKTKHKLEALVTAVRVFKTALGPLHKPPHKTTNPFQY